MEKYMISTETRNATLQDLATLLQEQHARKVDMVVPATKMRSKGGVLVVQGTEPVITDDGVTLADGRYLPTAVCDEGVAEKLGIPLPYVRKMRADRIDLYDANVNGWLHGKSIMRGGERETIHEPDSRSFLLRGFKGDDGEDGIARALLSDRYKIVDNLDVLLASLDGVKDAGVDVKIDGCDLTDRRMYVRVVAPEMTVLAENLLRNYRNPFGDDFDRWRQVANREGMGYGDGSEPIVFAGFVISNSETGNGAFTITPRMVIKVCKNGLTITKDAMRGVHLGGKMDEGTIAWSDDTREKQVALVKAQTRDAVKTFLDVDYMHRVIADVEEKAGAPVTDAAKTVQVIGKALSFSKETIDGVLEHFIRGGSTTAGGLMNAVTSYAQVIDNADVAADVEAQAMRALDMAVAAAR